MKSSLTRGSFGVAFCKQPMASLTDRYACVLIHCTVIFVDCTHYSQTLTIDHLCCCFLVILQQHCAVQYNQCRAQNGYGEVGDTFAANI